MGIRSLFHSGTSVVVYDSLGRPSASTYVIDGKVVSYSYCYLSNSTLIDKVNVICNGTAVEISYSYDELERVSNKSISAGENYLRYDYIYTQNGTYEGTLINEIAIRYANNTNSINYCYVYDNNGNIVQIKEGTVLKQSYEYDSLNQLIRENDVYANRTYVYTYDKSGNILSKKEYTYSTDTLGTLLSTTTYTYGNEAWGDLLTNYNGTNIVYDEIGNPLNWRNITSITWEQGRRLTAYTYVENGKTYNVTLGYNSDGIRIFKNIVNANNMSDMTLISYVLDGTTILREFTYQNGSARTLYYIYDASGDVIGFRYGGNTEYFYGKNAQGDVVALFDSNFELLARYYYDAWGNVISVKDANGNEITDKNNIALVNPIRYRSYYYDTDTGFYYLNTRYYDPQVGRFINADSIYFLGATGSTLSYNLFSYCENNCVERVDYLGTCYGYEDDPDLSSPYSGVKWGFNCGLYGHHARRPRCSEPIIVSGIDPMSPPDHPDYIPPKKWDGKKVKNPNGKGLGWPAKDGGVWMPDSNMHGGEGWTIQYPGGYHSHAYKGGGTRHHYEAQYSDGESALMIFAGIALSTFLIIDNVFGVGVADDPLIAYSFMCIGEGLDSVFGKKTCTICGEKVYED